MRQVPLSEAKDDFSRLLREAGKHDIVITRHGKPAGVLIGFETEDDWFEYRLETDPRFLQRIEKARASLRAGRRIRIEDLDIKTLDIEDLDIETLNIERVDSDKKA
jgi:prevent-host-death family protein